MATRRAPGVGTPRRPRAPGAARGARATRGRRGDEHARSTPGPGKGGTARRAWIALAVAFCVIVAGFVGFAGLYLVRRHHGRGVAVRVRLPDIASADGIARALFAAGVIDRPWLFSWILSLTGTVGQAPHGVVALRDDLAPRSILRALAAGTGVVRVTIPEGYTRFDIARRLVESGIATETREFLARTESPELLSRHGIRGVSFEGYLFPDTYDLSPGMAPDDVIDRLARNFRRRMDEIRARHPDGLARAAQAQLDEYAIVTLASMIEKETGAPEDRSRVAAVFWNRLTLPDFPTRLLQSDPTILYGCRLVRTPSCPETNALSRSSITRAMLDDARNAYNTYRHPALPPGPIANPGTRALEAALAPAATRDLYFVAMGNGRSAFATNNAEHEANVQRYLRRRP